MYLTYERLSSTSFIIHKILSQMNSQGNKYVMCWIFIQFRVIFLEHNPIQLPVVIFYWIVPTELHLIGLQTTSLNDE